ncbi:MAG: hypothetical protein HQ502_17240 [Alphaproteobacteria bacterium]|nr:hypothetical protein [Alphaproteobacteria bacterium]
MKDVTSRIIAQRRSPEGLIEATCKELRLATTTAPGYGPPAPTRNTWPPSPSTTARTS